MELVEEAEWQRISEIIDYTHRLLFRAALWRRLARPNVGPTVVLAVGFADLAGYTELSERSTSTSCRSSWPASRLSRTTPSPRTTGRLGEDDRRRGDVRRGSRCSR